MRLLSVCDTYFPGNKNTNLQLPSKIQNISGILDLIDPKSQGWANIITYIILFVCVCVCKNIKKDILSKNKCV